MSRSSARSPILEHALSHLEVSRRGCALEAVCRRKRARAFCSRPWTPRKLAHAMQLFSAFYGARASELSAL